MSEWTVNNKLNEWYEKQYHIKLPKQYVTKSRIYFSRSASPLALFAAGEAGVWYDPSDVANLTWRRNLLTWTEQFDNAVYTKVRTSIVPDITSAPDGTITADKLVENTDTNDHSINVLTNTMAIGNVCGSIFLKAAGRRYADIRLTGSANGVPNRVDVVADLQDGLITAQNGTILSATIEPAANGFYRVSVSCAQTTTNRADLQVFPWTSPTYSVNPAYTGDGTSGILIWGAQLELGSVATDYQRITDVNTEVIERFPTATLYQDTTGTIPVTTPGQAVALMLDKSKGLVLGPELVTNGGPFTATTGWTGGNSATVSVASAKLRVAGNGSLNFPFAYASLSTVVGRRYVFSAAASFVSGSNDNAYLEKSDAAPGASNNADSGVGPARTISFSFAATATTTFIRMGSANSNDVYDWDNISVRELPGNHATQATAASRPIYGIVPQGGRRNLLTFSEQFDNAAWVKNSSNAVANSTSDPTGAATGDTARLNVGTSLTVASSGLFTSATPYVSQPTAAALTAGSHTYSVYVKGGVGLSHVQLRVATSASLTPSMAYVVVRLSDGTLTGGSGGEAVSNAGGGWWRVSIPFTATAAIHHVGIWFWNDTSIASAAGTEGVYLWGAQLETGSTATPYQRVSSIYDVTEANVPSCSYLFFDGGSDSMATGNIDFTATDKMTIWAGVRKNSDAAAGMVSELSAAVTANDGSWYLLATTTPAYQVASKGTVARTATLPAPLPAPLTSIVTGLGDISGDNVAVRIDGTQVAASGSDQGTGNYGTYPLYIGARAGTGSFFNGNLFGLVVRGAASTTAQITSTEQWLAPKSTFFSPVITGIPTVGVS